MTAQSIFGSANTLITANWRISIWQNCGRPGEFRATNTRKRISGTLLCGRPGTKRMAQLGGTLRGAKDVQAGILNVARWQPESSDQKLIFIAAASIISFRITRQKLPSPSA